MKILLTNDDGINSKGINILEKLLSNYGEVYVVAPSDGKSGASSSLTIYKYFEVNKIDDHHYAVCGTPADCTIVGLNAIGQKFDLVVSGCNNGYNLSFDCIYSGTLGACFQALVQKAKTIAFSADYNKFDDIYENAKMAFDYILDNDLASNEYMLNVNFPLGHFGVAKDILITKQFVREIKYEIKTDGNMIMPIRQITNECDSLEYDVFAIDNGYTSITPLNMTRFDKNTYNKLIKKVK